jgi:hypothetical protein
VALGRRVEFGIYAYEGKRGISYRIRLRHDSYVGAVRSIDAARARRDEWLRDNPLPRRPNGSGSLVRRPSGRIEVFAPGGRYLGLAMTRAEGERMIEDYG